MKRSRKRSFGSLALVSVLTFLLMFGNSIHVFATFDDSEAIEFVESGQELEEPEGEVEEPEGEVEEPEDEVEEPEDEVEEPEGELEEPEGEAEEPEDEVEEPEGELEEPEGEAEEPEGEVEEPEGEVDKPEEKEDELLKNPEMEMATLMAIQATATPPENIGFSINMDTSEDLLVGGRYNVSITVTNQGNDYDRRINNGLLKIYANGTEVVSQRWNIQIDKRRSDSRNFTITIPDSGENLVLRAELSGDLEYYEPPQLWPPSFGGWKDINSNFYRETSLLYTAVQPTTLEFQVSDGITPIPKATITIDGNNIKTNSEGKASIDIKSGHYDYQVVADGFMAVTGEVQAVGDKVNVPVIMVAEIKDKSNAYLKLSLEGIKAVDEDAWQDVVNGLTLVAGKDYVVKYKVQNTYEYYFGGPIFVNIVKILFEANDEAGGFSTSSKIKNLESLGTAVDYGQYTFTAREGNRITINNKASGEREFYSWDKQYSEVSFWYKGVPATYPVTFTVTSDKGPIEGGEVTVDGVKKTTNSDGQVVFDLPNGTYNYTVEKAGYGSQSGEVVVNGGAQSIAVTMIEINNDIWTHTERGIEAKLAENYHSGDPHFQCEFGGEYHVKRDRHEDPLIVLEEGTIEIIYDGNKLVGWKTTGSIEIVAVYVKGGPQANVFNYTGTGYEEDSHLFAPVNPSNKHADISHVRFSYNIVPPTTEPTGTLIIQKRLLSHNESFIEDDDTEFKVQITGPGDYNQIHSFSVNNSLELTGLSLGTYYIEEVLVPNGYFTLFLDPSEGIVVLSEENLEATVTITNMKLPPAKIIFQKEILEGTEEDLDTEFTIWVFGDGIEEAITISVNQEGVLDDLTPGWYSFYEDDEEGDDYEFVSFSKNQEGLELEEGMATVELDAGETMIITVTNRKINNEEPGGEEPGGEEPGGEEPGGEEPGGEEPGGEEPGDDDDDDDDDDTPSSGGGGGGTGGGSTTPSETVEIEDEIIPLGTPEVEEIVVLEEVPGDIEAEEILILDEEVPLGVTQLPKTGEANPIGFYLLGLLFMVIGIRMRKVY